MDFISDENENIKKKKRQVDIKNFQQDVTN